jgi:hypothetical protein
MTVRNLELAPFVPSARNPCGHLNVGLNHPKVQLRVTQVVHDPASQVHGTHEFIRVSFHYNPLSGSASVRTDS